LQLLNTTVQSLALSVNRVLSSSYHAIYDDAIEGDELVLLTAPLSSTAEVQALYTAGIVDIESAIPAALHSLGCSATEIEGALLRRREAEKANGDSKLLEAQTAAQIGDADVKLKAAQALKTQEEIEGVRAGVEKSRAEVKKIEHDANAPYPSTTPAEPLKKKKDDNEV
jgi:peptidoglycan hydrolase CwlO-like protein